MNTGPCDCHNLRPLYDLVTPFNKSRFYNYNSNHNIEPRTIVYARKSYNPRHLYFGELWQAKRDGIGTCLYANGDAYSGEWCLGRRHGWGFSIKKNGSRYEGTWSHNQQFGFGVDSEVNYAKYAGEFVASKRYPFNSKGH